MTPINPTSLFHFTSDLEVLKQILRNGLRFSFCIETFPGALAPQKSDDICDVLHQICNKKVQVAIPMICFCDIPLSRIGCHIKKYGQYGIGLNKQKIRRGYNFKGSFELNPLMYICSESLTSPLNELCSIIGRMENNKDKTTLLRLLGFCKFYDNHHMSEIHGDTYKCFYDEREWRMVYPDNADSGTAWMYSYEISDFTNAVRTRNEEFHKSHVAFMPLWGECKSKFPTDFITHIIVDRENEIPVIIKFIQDECNSIFGISDMPKEDRAMLCSKVTSLERIDNDY